jgi:hypothetical protein
MNTLVTTVNGARAAMRADPPRTDFANNGVGPDTTHVVTVHVVAFTSAPSVGFHKGVAGSFTVTTDGGATGLALSATLTTRQAGLTFHDNGDGTATLSGTPGSTDRSATVTLTATVGGIMLVQKLAIGVS